MSKHDISFTDRIKASLRKKLIKEVDQFQTFDQEYKISSHPIKRTFIAISKLNSIRRGKIGIPEIAHEAELSEQDVIFIIQEFIDQRLIEGVIEKDKTLNSQKEQILVLKQDHYFCQIDQMEHSSFELRMQCSQCLRFICMNCYRKSEGDTCPFCQGNLIPVPRIFKKTDIQTSPLKPTDLKESLSEYYKTQKSNISQQGVKKVSSKVWGDVKELSKGLSFSTLKEKTQNYLDYRKHENSISKNEKNVLDAISVLYEIEETNEIPFTRLAKITNLEIPLVLEIVSRLIAHQAINGFIETGGTFDTIFDDKLILGSNVFHCEILDQDFPVTSAHYQCNKCFRAFSNEAFVTIKEQGIKDCLYCGGKITYFPGKKK